MLFLLGGLLTLVAAASSSGTGSGPDQYGIVELTDSPVAEYAGGIPGYQATKALHGNKLDLASADVVKYEAYLSTRHASYQAWLRSNAPWAQVVREYSLTFNGFAVLVRGNSLNSLANGPGVKAVEESWLYTPSMDVSVPLIRAPEVWSALGVEPFANPADLGDLADIKVGVIDTGILDTHPFIASCRAPGSIEHDVFFSGTGTAAFGPTIFFDHGTHVAGTIGGCPTAGPFTVGDTALTLDGTFGDAMSGVAPGVTLHDYNVFPGYGAGFIAFGGSAFSHDIIAAVEKAVSDGMDVINLSLGGGVQGPHDTLAEAINAAVNAGTIAVIAAGNSGPGILTVESPGNAANAITAGASTNPHYLAIDVVTSSATYGAAIGDFGSFSTPVTGTTAFASPKTACTSTSNVTGKIALINRGACTFGTKIANAQKAGATAVIVVNNVAGDPIAMGSDEVHFPTIPAAMVSKPDGTVLMSGAPQTVTIDGAHPYELLTPNADILAGFSSKGPTPYDFRIKPDVTAPGVNVLSSVFTRNADGTYAPSYAFFQGTSMATPHTTGAAALLLAAHPGWSPEQVKSALVNNADRTVTGTSGLGPLARGGGRINVERAMNAAATFDPASVSFGGFTGGKPVFSSVDVTVTSEWTSSQTCSVSLTAGSSAWLGFVGVSSTSFTLGAGGAATVTVTFDGGQTAASGLYWGDVKFTCDGGTFLAPWFAGIQRSNGFLNGNQNSPASYIDPAYYGDPSFLVASVWTG